MIFGFIIFSSLVFLLIGRPVMVLLWAGTLNGFILPLALALILVASRKSKIVGDYKHPLLMQICGWLVELALSVLSIYTLINEIRKMSQ